MNRLAILLAVFACGSSEGTAPADVLVAYGEPFDLSPGEVAAIDEDSHVTFTRIAEESRCPAGATCIEAGNAAAVFALDGAAGSATLTLNTDREPRRAAAAGLTLDLIELNPRPEEGVAIDSAGYEATLIVDPAP